MKKALAILLSCAMLLTGCSLQDTVDTSSESSILTATEQTTVSESNVAATSTSLESVDTSSEEYINSLGFTSLNDPNLISYVEDTVYTDLVNQLDSDKYFVENVEAVYISKEYLDELDYNSQENIYFGHKLSELDKAFEGKKYIFTLGENGQTDVVPFEEYDDTYDKVIRNVAIGTGVILLCVTVSATTGGLGAPAVSMIFSASAKSATTFALSTGVISGVSAGVVEGIETQDFDKAMKAAALKGSEGYMWGAITGAITGGVGKATALKGATRKGLTMNEAAEIQKDSKLPLSVIKNMKSKEEYNIYKKAGLKSIKLGNKKGLVRDIDLNYKSELAGKEVTNLERIQRGYPPIDPKSGKAYELHHVGQEVDSPLAMLTQEEHRLGENNKILHNTNIKDGNGVHSQISTKEWNKQKKEFWKNLAKELTK